MVSPRTSHEAATGTTGGRDQDTAEHPRRLSHSVPPASTPAGDDASLSPLKEARVENDLTQEAVGLAVGVDAQTIARWESGKSLPRAPSRRRLAELFDRPIEDLIPDLRPAQPQPVEPTPGIGIDIDEEQKLVDGSKPRLRLPPAPKLRLRRPGRVAATVSAAALVAVGGIAIVASGDDDTSPRPTRVAAAALTPQQKIDQRINAALARGDYDQALTIANALGDSSRGDAIKARAVGVLLGRTDTAIADRKLDTARTLLGRAKDKYGDPLPADTAKRWSQIHEVEAREARAKARAEAKRQAAARAKRAAAARKAAAKRRAAPAPTPSSSSTPSTSSGSTSSTSQSSPAPSNSAPSTSSPAPSTTGGSSGGGGSKSSGSKSNDEFGYLGG